MRNLLTVIALLLASKASAVGPLINGNQINPQTAISIATLTVTGARDASFAHSVTASSFTATGTGFGGAGTNLTGTAASLTAGNVTTNANLTGDVTSVGNAATNVKATGVFTMLSTATVKGNAFSVGGSTLVVSGGQVGIGNTSPAVALDVTGSINVSSVTNIMNKVSSIPNGSSSIVGYSVCITTLTLTTHGSPVVIMMSGDGSNSTINDGCGLWVLQDGAYINSETKTAGLAENHSPVANQSQMLTWAGIINGNPSAGTHNYCWGLGAITGGTCSAGDQVNMNFAVFEVR